MELKDVILSTLAELEEVSSPAEEAKTVENIQPVENMNKTTHEPSTQTESLHETTIPDHGNDEVRMLEGIRERLLVLFEGFQSPNNVQLEAKIDLTLNFLEYLLAMIDNRLETLKED